MTDDAPRISGLKAAALSAGPIIMASFLGNAATIPNIAPWYEGLVKPPLNPPNWVFGPVWTLLYVLMGVAFYRILRSPDSARRRRAIWLFAAQLLFNTGWSFAFFAAARSSMRRWISPSSTATPAAQAALDAQQQVQRHEDAQRLQGLRAGGAAGVHAPPGVQQWRGDDHAELDGQLDVHQARAHAGPVEPLAMASICRASSMSRSDRPCTSWVVSVTDTWR